MKKEKKGVEESLKSTALDILENEIKKELSKPHKVVNREKLLEPYLLTLEEMFRHLVHDVKIVHDKTYKGFIFVAWIQNNKLFTKIIEL